MIEIAGTTYYFSELGLWAYGLLYLPAVLLSAALVHWLFLKRIDRRWRSAVLTIFLIPALTWPFWDVYLIGQEATRLCREKGGLKVYRTAEVEGFLGDPSIKYWSKFGFSYVEDTLNHGKELYRYTMRDSKPHQEEVKNLRSHYKLHGTKESLNKWISRINDKVENRNTGEVLGEFVLFTIQPGKFDHAVIGLSGITFSPWHCGDNYKNNMGEKKLVATDLVRRTLIPK